MDCRMFNPLHFSKQTLALACHKMQRDLDGLDAETQDAIARVADPAAEIRREDATQLAIALLLEVRARTRAPRR
jgi:hypothetical protein